MKRIKKLKVTLIACLFCLLSNVVLAQIHFEKGLSWDQVRAKAKSEHKYIFVDCYATWCGPCKDMDQKVYIDPALGRFFNPLFISVKMQMDSSKADDQSTIASYADARQIRIEQAVSAFPTYLFFSPNGQLVHRSTGGQDAPYFLKTALMAADPSQQVYTQLSKFKNGKLPDSEIPGLVRGLEQAEDKNTANYIAQQYIEQYLLELPDRLLLKMQNIGFMARYTKHSLDKAFLFFFKRSVAVDSVAGKGTSDDIIIDIIAKEDINTALWLNGDKAKPLTLVPDWAAISNLVAAKYDRRFANLALIYPKIAWYKQTKEWPLLVNAEIAKIENFALDSTGRIAGVSMNAVNEDNYSYIFLHSTNADVLRKAIGWQKMIVEANPSEPDYLDTYANLLYKIGNRSEALIWEGKAVALKIKWFNAIEQRYGSRGKNDVEYVRSKETELNSFKDTISKMKEGRPTW